MDQDMLKPTKLLFFVLISTSLSACGPNIHDQYRNGQISYEEYRWRQKDGLCTMKMGGVISSTVGSFATAYAAGQSAYVDCMRQN